MSNKFKYVLFSDQTYIVEFEDFDGNIIRLDVPGEHIVGKLRKEYLLDKIIKDPDLEIMLDKLKDLE